VKSAVHDVIMRRRSVRAFDDRPIEAEVVDALLDAAANAPSGGNIQPVSVILVRDARARERLAAIVGRQPWVANAPLSMVFCLDFHRTKRWARLFEVDSSLEDAFQSFLIGYADVVCAAQNVVLVAEDLGLGSVYVGTIQSAIDDAREMLGTPQQVAPLLVLSLGYPKRIPTGIRKLGARAMAHEERYEDPDDDELREAFDTKYGAIDEDFERYLERAYVELVEAERQGEEAWPRVTRSRAKRLNVASNAQFLFELRYPSRALARGNRRIVESLGRAGFSMGLGDAGESDER